VGLEVYIFLKIIIGFAEVTCIISAPILLPYIHIPLFLLFKFVQSKRACGAR
jgi:hypothetical protein